MMIDNNMLSFLEHIATLFVFTAKRQTYITYVICFCESKTMCLQTHKSLCVHILLKLHCDLDVNIIGYFGQLKYF